MMTAPAAMSSVAVATTCIGDEPVVGKKPDGGSSTAWKAWPVTDTPSPTIAHTTSVCEPSATLLGSVTVTDDAAPPVANTTGSEYSTT